MKKIIITVVLVLSLSACSPTQKHTSLSYPLNTDLTVGIGEEIYRINKTRDLPNVWGKADVFGRQVDSGFEGIRYLGLKKPSTVKLVFHSIDIYSDETTVRGSGAKFYQSNTAATANVSGNQFSANGYGNSTTTGYGFSAPEANKAILPNGDIEFEHNYKKEPIIKRGNVSIEIIDATNSSITYKLLDIKK